MTEKPAQNRRKRQSIFRKIGIYLPTISTLGIAVPVLIFLIMMQINGWQLPAIGLRGFTNQAGSASQQIFLYESPSSRTYFTKIGGNYEVLLTPWRNYFKERKISFESLKDAKAIAKQSDGVLVVPSALALGDAERDAILAFKARGGGILVTWASGTRNSTGDWSGWQFLESLGAKVVGEMPADSESRQLTLNGESPLSFQQPAGARIWMGKTTESLLRLTGDNVAARFMNWPRVPEAERRSEGAIVFAETAATTGRSAIFAFAETSWESRPFVPSQVIDDTLKWLRREPTVVKAAWPDGKTAAQVIEMDTEQGFENASAFADMMKGINYRPTFYVLTSVAIQFPDLLKNLAAHFELAYHGDVHVSFKDQPANIQAQRIQTMKSDLASVLNDTTQITGFRAPTEGYDATTEQLLQQQGIRHHAADPSRLDGRLPVFAKIEGVAPEQSLVVMARTQRDDINLYGEKLNVEQLTQALVDDFELALNTGALGFLSVHSQNFGADSVLRQAMPDYLQHLQQRRASLWLASSNQVAQWWRERERLFVTPSVAGKRLDFNLTVKGEQPITGASLIIMLPQKDVVPTVRSTKIGALLPKVVKLDSYRAAVVFDNLPPGDYVYQATFTP